jgi:hypothetical protein
MNENGKQTKDCYGVRCCFVNVTEREEEEKEEDEELMPGGRRTDRETQTQHVCMARAKFL